MRPAQPKPRASVSGALQVWTSRGRESSGSHHAGASGVGSQRTRSCLSDDARGPRGENCALGVGRPSWSTDRETTPPLRCIGFGVLAWRRDQTWSYSPPAHRARARARRAVPWRGAAVGIVWLETRVAATLPVGRHSQRCPTARCSMEPQRGVARRDSMPRRQQSAWVGPVLPADDARSET